MSDVAPLRAWLATYPTPAEPVDVVHAGSVEKQADGTETITMDHMPYGDAILALWDALDQAGWAEIDTSDYLAVVDQWRARTGRPTIDSDGFADMDRHTLFNALRWFNRGERFCDGLWASAWKSGQLHAGARAVLALQATSG